MTTYTLSPVGYDPPVSASASTVDDACVALHALLIAPPYSGELSYATASHPVSGVTIGSGAAACIIWPTGSYSGGFGVLNLALTESGAESPATAASGPSADFVAASSSLWASFMAVFALVWGMKKIAAILFQINGE